MKGTTGGIVDKDDADPFSNVAMFNPATQKADRVGFKVHGGRRKVRVSSPTAKWSTRKEKEHGSFEDITEKRSCPT